MVKLHVDVYLNLWSSDSFPIYKKKKKKKKWDSLNLFLVVCDCLLVICACLLLACGRFLVVCGRLLVVCGYLLVVCSRLLVVCGRLLVFCDRLSYFFYFCWFVVVACFSNYVRKRSFLHFWNWRLVSLSNLIDLM